MGALTLDPPSSRWVGTKFTRLCPCSRWTPLGAGRVGIGRRRKSGGAEMCILCPEINSSVMVVPGFPELPTSPSHTFCSP